MSQLYELCQRINVSLEAKHASSPLDLVRAKGTLATEVGFLVSLVTPSDPDDPDKVAALKSASTKLGIDL